MRLSRPSTKAMLHPEKKLCFVHTCQIPFLFCQTSIHCTAQEEKAVHCLKAGGLALKDTQASAQLSQVASLNLALFAQPQEGDKKSVFLSAPAPGNGCSGQRHKSQVPREDISGNTAVSESYRTLLLETSWEAEEQRAESYEQALLSG